MRRLLLVIILLIAAGLPATAGVTYKRATLTITPPGTRTYLRAYLRVEVADTPASRGQGLMHRKRLAENAGMLFIFEKTGNYGFWMKNTLLPLSIAFIGEDWHIVDIVDMDVAPNPEQGPFKIYESAKAFRYALEVNQGFFKRKGIGIDAAVTYRPAIP